MNTFRGLALCFASLSRTIALRHPINPRADTCRVQNDGPTSDRNAGIGAEFESPIFYFTDINCGNYDTVAARGRTIAGRSGRNWRLTADVGPAMQGHLNAEFILDGRSIKVGTGDARAAGVAAAKDLAEWEPWNQGIGAQYVNIEENVCNPWQLSSPSRGSKVDDVEWQPQITAPMPLEGLYRLMQQNDAWERESMLPEEEEADHNVLTGLTDGSVVPEDDKVPRDDENSSSDWGSDGGQAPGPSKGKDTGKENDPIAFNPGLKLVTQQYFRSDAIELDHTRVTDDVLAFCSMVLSYAKAAQALDASPKKLLAFMPRTEFNTIFRQVKPKLPDDLFALFNSLACYKTEFSGNVVVDQKFCSGKPTNPEPNGEFSKMKWKNGQSKVEVRSWIEGIGRGSPSPDLLTEFDQLNDGSLGGLGEALEKMHNSDRAVPLFEFRDLKHKRTDQFGDFLAEVDQSIQDLHRDFAQAPRMMKRDTIGACTPPYYTNHTSTGISGSHVTGALDSNQLHRALASGTGTLTTSTIAPT